jgi:hypothetical protein
MVYLGAQTQPAVKQDTVPDGANAQYVVRKLRLLEAHRINRGDDVLVAVIDSKIDTRHPDLTGVIADEFDAVGTQAPAHAHGTAIAGVNSRKQQADWCRTESETSGGARFSGTGESAQSTFNILKGLDWEPARTRASST